MVFTFSEEALKIAIAQLAQNVGWHGIGSNSYEILIDLCARFMKEIGKTSTCIANQYNRTHVNYNDLQLAFNYLNISVSELEDYYTHVESIPFVKGVPARYPVQSSRGPKRINYPDPSELKARSEFYEEWMPSIRLDAEDSGLLNSKIGKDSELNEDSLINGIELSEEEIDKRYLNSMRKQVGPSEKIDGYTELDALLPNYIYLSKDGRALSYGGNEGKLPECRLPPLTADDLERMQQEEERRQQELQREKEKAFQPLKLKINNKDKLKFKKYLSKGAKSSNDYMSKELLKRAKKEKKLKPKMNLNKFSIKMYASKATEAERNILKQKQDLLETAEKLGLSSEIDEIKKFSRLKERTMKEKKIKVLKEEDLEKQRRKRERMRKKQEELERKQRMREERRMRKEAREREKEEKRKARELKRMEKLKAKLEKARKPRATKKTKAAQSKADMDDTNSNLSLNSSLTNTSTLKNTSMNSSNLNEYDEKEAANILVSLSEDKKSAKKSTKRQNNKPISSPLISTSSDEDSSEDEDDNSSNGSITPPKNAKKREEIKSNKKLISKKPDLKKNGDPPAAPKPPFKSLAERKAMPPTILESSKPKAPEPAKKLNKIKKRKNESKDDEINDLFKPTFTLPTIKKKPIEKKPKKKVSDDLIETSSSSSSSEDERALISKKKKDDKKRKTKKESLPKLTVKFPSRTNSPLPSSLISPKSSKKDKLVKKDEKKLSKKDLTPDKKGKKDEALFKESSKKIDKPASKLAASNPPKPDENRPKKKAKVIITPTKAARKEAAEKGSCVLVTQTVSTNDAEEKVYYCPSCSKPDDGSPMLGECGFKACIFVILDYAFTIATD